MGAWQCSSGSCDGEPGEAGVFADFPRAAGKHDQRGAVCLVVVVIPAGDDHQVITINAIDEAIGFVDTA